MTRPLSNDLRRRLIDAVLSGLSRRAAAERFGVAPSTAIRWVESYHKTGRPDPRAQGGDKRSHRIEAHGPELLALIEEAPDITLVEMAEHLREAYGWRVAVLDGVAISGSPRDHLQKKPHTPASSTGLMFWRAAGFGLNTRQISTPSALSLSMRRELQPKWQGCAGVHCAGHAAAHPFRTAIGKPQPLSAAYVLAA